MGELKYTLFYMGFVLKEEKKTQQNQQHVENPASEHGHRGMVLPLKMLTKVHYGPRSSIHTCRAAECQHHLLPGEWPGHKGSIHIKTALVRRGSFSPPLQALVHTALDSADGPGSGLTPSHFPPDFLSHSLRFTGKQQ